MTDRKRITFVSEQQRALKELYNGKNGGDLNVLQVFSRAVVNGQAIEENFQLVVNAIVAQSVFREKLPSNPKGRPIKPDMDYGYDVAYRYFELKDSGVSYSDSVAEVAASFHKDERHIMRLVKENKHLIGLTADDRNKTRASLKTCCNSESKYLIYVSELLKEDREQQPLRQPVAELDDLIDKLLERTLVADTNATRFIVSD